MQKVVGIVNSGKSPQDLSDIRNITPLQKTHAFAFLIVPFSSGVQTAPSQGGMRPGVVEDWSRIDSPILRRLYLAQPYQINLLQDAFP
jgi:hypothetical protein